MKNPNRFYFKNGVILPLTDEKPADYLLTSTDEFSVLKDVFPGSIARVNGKEYQLDPNGNWEEKAGSSPEEIKNRIRFYIKDGHICPLGDDLPSEYYVATMDELAQLAPLVFPGSIAYVNGQKYELDPHGDWDRKAEGGGGGATTMEDLLDVVVNEPTEGQVLVYDDYNDKWKNQDAPTGLPDVTTADEGKLLTVDSEGEWAAIELQVAPGEVVIDNTLLVAGAAADAKAAGDRIRNLEENKANIDGYYENLTAGNAEQIISTVGVEDKVPYLLRTAGGTADIGNRETDKIIGGTVAWNQQITSRFVSGNVIYANVGCTTSYADNIATITKTEANPSYLYANVLPQRNHVYLAVAMIKGQYTLVGFVDVSGAITKGLRYPFDASTVPDDKFIESYCIYSKTQTENAYPAVRNATAGGADRTFYAKDLQIFDLTQMFGPTIADYIYGLETANAGAGVAWFRKYFPKPYYPYNDGELLSVKTSAHKTTGFNQFNGTVNLGYRWNNGEYVAANLNYAATNDRTPCIGGTAYCFYFPGLTNTISIYVQEFDAAGNWLRSKPYTSITTTNKYATVTTSADAHFIAISLYKEQGFVSADVAQVCINLHWSGYRDGEYEAYEEHAYPLDPDLELRGILKLNSANELYYDGDEYESDGTVTRKYGVVDLGTLNWYYQPSLERFNAIVTGIKAIPITSSPQAICVKYSVITGQAFDADITVSGTLRVDNVSAMIYIRDLNYSDKESFKTAMSGIYLVYELATSTTESADPFTNPQAVNDFGTEEYVDARTVAMPVGHETVYMANLRDKLQHLPDLAESNGNYYITQTDNQMTLTAVPELIIDDALSIEGAPADAKAVGDKVNELESAFSGRTRNLFDMDTIPYTKDEEGYFSRTAKQLNSEYRYTPGFTSGIEFEENTQYVVSMTAYTAGNSSTSGNGIRVYIHYTDASFEYIQWANNVITPTRKSCVSTKDKTISFVGFEYASNGDNIWYIKEIQIENGIEMTEYIPYITAGDKSARYNLAKLMGAYPYGRPTNVVDIGTVLNGYVRKDNGAFSENAKYSCTDFVRVLGEAVYVRLCYPSNDMSGLCFYDENKNFIIGYGSEELGAYNELVRVNVPDNAWFIRTSRYNTSNYQIEIYNLDLNSELQTINERMIALKTGNPANPLSTIIQTGGQYGTLNKIGIIGDSLSVGGMNSIGSQAIDPDVTKSWYSWPKILERMTGVETHVFAHGGYNTGDWLNTYGNNQDFITNWCMAYIIGLGENDRSSGTHHLDLGTESDVSITSREDCAPTYYGNLANIILRCKEAATNARIFILTNPRPEGESSGYNAAVRYVANAFGTSDKVYLVDLYQYAHEIYAQYITDQNYWYGGHMTAIGYRMAAYHISTYIDWIIRMNPRDFRDIQFITGNQ